MKLRFDQMSLAILIQSHEIVYGVGKCCATPDQHAQALKILRDNKIQNHLRDFYIRYRQNPVLRGVCIGEFFDAEVFKDGKEYKWRLSSLEEDVHEDDDFDFDDFGIDEFDDLDGEEGDWVTVIL